MILPGRVAQSVTCLATDACLTAGEGGGVVKSCRNNKKRENLEYYFITCIFPNVKLKPGFRISCSVRRKSIEESTSTALTPNLLGISTLLGFLISGGKDH